MTDDAQGHITCPDCGKHYRWKQQYAGQRVKCKACGGVLVMPIIPPNAPLESASMLPDPANQPPADDGAYALDLPDDDPYQVDLPDDDAGQYEIETNDSEAALITPEGKCPNCGTSVNPTAVICLNCGFNLKEGTRLETQVVADAVETNPSDAGAPGAKAAPTPALVDDDPDHKMEEIYVPLGLIATGIVLILLDSFVLLDTQYMNDPTATTPSMTLRLIYLAVKGIQTAVQLPLLFAGILVIGMLFGTSFSSIGSAILKFLGVALFLTGFGGSIDSLLDRMTGGFGGMAWMLRTSITFPAFWGINAWMFDLEFVEVIILYVVMIFVPAFLMMFVLAMLLA